VDNDRECGWKTGHPTGPKRGRQAREEALQVAGHNALAILAAAVVMYLIGFALYGFLFSDLWMSLSGVTEDSFAGEEWRMGLSPIMPILIAIGMSMAVKWRGAKGATAGAMTGLLVAIFFLFAGRLYAYAYSAEPAGLLGIDTLHFLLIATAAGAIIAGWPAPKAPA
jgi:hypothetical protein